MNIRPFIAAALALAALELPAQPQPGFGGRWITESGNLGWRSRLAAAMPGAALSPACWATAP